MDAAAEFSSTLTSSEF